jgi:McrBC 5-methylcytosine restriction system component
MATWEILDSQSTELVGFDISWLPAKAYSYVTPRVEGTLDRVERVYLEAQPYVGALPLKNGDTLYIVPRAGRDSFSRMLLLSEGLDDAIRDEFEDLVRLGYQTEESLSWTHLLAHPYLHRLRLIEKLSLMPGRIHRGERKTYAQGRVLVPSTLVSLARNEELPVHCQFRDKTYATIENRTLATAVLALHGLGAIDAGHTSLAARWLRLANGRWVSSDELRQVMVGLQSRRYVGPRSYYIPALLMARLILAQAGIVLQEERAVEAETLLINMPILFERYVRRVIANTFSGQGYVVEKRTRARAPELFLDGTAKLEPDIVISDASGVRLLADAKYKTRDEIGSPDYYQMCAYLDRFSADKGMLILPHSSRTKTTLVKRELFSGKQIYELRLPLQDWKAAEIALQEHVETVVAA